MVHGLLLDPFKESFIVSSGVSGSGGQTSSSVAPPSGQAQSAQAQHHQQRQQQVANMVRALGEIFCSSGPYNHTLCALRTGVSTYAVY